MNYQGIRFLIWQLRSIGRSVKSHGTLCFIVILQYYIRDQNASLFYSIYAFYTLFESGIYSEKLVGLSLIVILQYYNHKLAP